MVYVIVIDELSHTHKLITFFLITYNHIYYGTDKDCVQDFLSLDGKND